MQAAYTIYSWMVRGFFGALKQARRIARHGKPQNASGSKIDRFIELQSAWREKLAGLRPARRGRKTIWFHASSLGEYQIARPIIKKLKNNGKVRIVFTFFSSTAIDALKGTEKTSTTPDLILPFPLDTKDNARAFLDKVRPDTAVFMVSELWPNFLNALRRRKIPILLYSALIREKSHSVSGTWFRKAMIRKFDKIAVHDDTSLKSLRALGFGNAVRAADPLFDNAIAKRDEAFDNDIIKRFCQDAGNVLVAGSLHMDKDLEMTAALARRFPGTKIILVPHEISPKKIEKTVGVMPGNTVLYSEGRMVDDWSGVQCLVIDFIGALAQIYRFGTAAYVGGGFTRLLHSVIEPLVYGIPVAYGPQTGRKYITGVMEQEGIGTVTADSDSLCQWWDDIVSGRTDLAGVKENASRLCSANQGGAMKAARMINQMTDKK